MKQVKTKLPLRMLALICGLILSATAFAQQITVNGHVKDATGEAVIGATIRVVGQTGGAISDFDGNFVIKANKGDKLSVTYIGYDEAIMDAAPNVVVTLQDDAAQSLNEVVVIGYGAVKKNDLTGSVTALKPDTKNKGLVVSAQDMMQGKIAGVNVTSGGGTPGGGATIRIRGGSSLNASNDPLIVIDGIPMDNNGVKGLANGLSMVNPADIESFNVLKDASATAIYGSRGSNGVIIITTKKGHKNQGMQVTYNGNVSASMKKKTVDVMDGDEYRAFMHSLFDDDAAPIQAMGNANTDWQEEIYRTAISHDHNVTLTGSVKNLPFRVSLGYTGEEGILKTSDFKRYTAAINLSPSFFQDHLTLNLNAKGLYAESRYADGNAISGAVWMDPTHPVMSSDPRYKNIGGYFGWMTDGSSLNDTQWTEKTFDDATKNPVAVLDLKNDRARSRSFIGNAEIDYKIHGFEDLRLHATFGADISKGKQNTDVSPMSPLANYYGSFGWDEILKRNLSVNAYAQYYKDFNDNHHFDIMGGYEWQHFWRSQHNNYWGMYPSTNTEKPNQKYKETKGEYKTENYLVSFFGRMNYTLLNRYLLTVTVRDDGSSRFREHWALFPSTALAWRIHDEPFMKSATNLSDLKLRLGWGKTGQQEGIGDYNYFAVYQTIDPALGGNGFYPIIGTGQLYRPQAYDKDLTWETTETYNVGLDFGCFNQRFTASLDWYYRKTTDLLNTRYVSAGSNFRNQVTSNIGSLKNTGIELAMSWKALQTKDWYWTIDYNFTYNENKITELIGGDDKDYYIPTGGISAGTGNTCQAHAVGHAASSFLVYQQAYDKNGMPLEGVLVDRDGNGVINESDKYYYKNPMAPVTMGLSSRLEYKNFDLGFALRASIGNYVFNDQMAGSSNISKAAMWRQDKFSQNRPVAVLPYKWASDDEKSVLSDRYVQNGSFLKMDNVTLGYSFANLLRGANYGGISGRIYGSVTNVFTITKYKGIDPEVFGGIDNNIYPRPITFQLGLTLNF